MSFLNSLRKEQPKNIWIDIRTRGSVNLKRNVVGYVNYRHLSGVDVTSDLMFLPIDTTLSICYATIKKRPLNFIIKLHKRFEF